MAKVLIPTPLRKFTNNASKVELEGDNVIEVLTSLTNNYPDLKPYLLDNDKVKPYIKLFKGEEDIESLDNEATRLESTDTLSIVPAIAGG
ncbi:MAG: MoaD/ThiS family protein [Saprospiraceae bacterium]|nr:MoaD/ThiS family protein [Saprospiraceae bacterium]